MPFSPPITDQEIKDISDLTLDDLQPFVEVAEVLVDDLLADVGHSDALLRKIGVYLSAHFAYLKEGQVKSEKIGDSSTTFNMATGLGLESTTFGQMAMTLDSSKKLSTANDNSITSGSAELEVY